MKDVCMDGEMVGCVYWHHHPAIIMYDRVSHQSTRSISIHHSKAQNTHHSPSVWKLLLFSSEDESWSFCWRATPKEEDDDDGGDDGKDDDNDGKDDDDDNDDDDFDDHDDFDDDDDKDDDDG